MAQRVKRVATGWEPQLTIATDAVMARSTLFELCEAFYATGAPTRLKIRAETLSGTLEALRGGLADLALAILRKSPLNCERAFLRFAFEFNDRIYSAWDICEVEA